MPNLVPDKLSRDGAFSWHGTMNYDMIMKHRKQIKFIFDL